LLISNASEISLEKYHNPEINLH